MKEQFSAFACAGEKKDGNVIVIGIKIIGHRELAKIVPEAQGRRTLVE